MILSTCDIELISSTVRVKQLQLMLRLRDVCRAKQQDSLALRFMPVLFIPHNNLQSLELFFLDKSFQPFKSSLPAVVMNDPQLIDSFHSTLLHALGFERSSEHQRDRRDKYIRRILGSSLEHCILPT
jgi:hypothetical protein